MPRPMKYRRVCELPSNTEFMPVKTAGGGKPPVVLTVDEYETIRLIDNVGLSQEECGESMQVARTTVQLIYDTARKKVADALVNGRGIKIEGGAYRLCDGTGRRGCCCGNCRRFRGGRNTEAPLDKMPRNEE